MRCTQPIVRVYALLDNQPASCYVELPQHLWRSRWCIARQPHAENDYGLDCPMSESPFHIEDFPMPGLFGGSIELSHFAQDLMHDFPPMNATNNDIAGPLFLTYPDLSNSGFPEIEPPPGNETPPPATDTPPPSGESGLEVNPGDTPGNDQGLDHLKQAIARASSGGPPVSILQYGDSHIVEGTQAKTIESLFSAVAPVQYATQAQNGISANYPSAHPQEWLDQPIAQSNPDLVILSFGSNDSASAVNPDQYAQTYQKLIDDVRQRAPEASILIVGPSDGNAITGANSGQDLPGLDTVIQVQKDIAARNGLSFFDLRESMGGPGSIEQWHAQGLAAGDELHFTSAGYEKLGQTIFAHIQQGTQTT